MENILVLVMKGVVEIKIPIEYRTRNKDF